MDKPAFKGKYLHNGARGVVYKRDGVWHCRVYDSLGKDVFYDNSGHYDLIANSVREDVYVARRVENASHVFYHSYSSTLRNGLDNIPMYKRNKKKHLDN